MTPELSDEIAAARSALDKIEQRAAALVQAPTRRELRGDYIRLGMGDDWKAAPKLLDTYPQFNGFLFERHWRTNNPVLGAYNFEAERYLLDECLKRPGKGVIWYTGFKAFGGRTDVCPAEFTPFSHKPNCWSAPVHEPDCLAGYLEFIATAGIAIGGHLALVGVENSETAPGKTLQADKAKTNAMEQVWPVVWQATRDAFPDVPVFADCNYFVTGPRVLALRAKALSIGCAVGSPDAFTTAGNAGIPDGVTHFAQVSQGALTDTDASTIESCAAWTVDNRCIARSWPTWSFSYYTLAKAAEYAKTWPLAEARAA